MPPDHPHHPHHPKRRQAGAWLLALASGPVWAQAPLPLSELALPGRLLMLRHANAPGVGDPPQLRLGDCSTQRNLDAAGRAQASALGRKVASVGVRQAKVYSSQWCRCLDTARLLGLGPVAELPALNSFFEMADTREGNLAALRAFVAGLPQNAPLVVMVTHQVTISAMAGRGVASGHGVLLQLDGSAQPRWLGDVAPG